MRGIVYVSKAAVISLSVQSAWVKSDIDFAPFGHKNKYHIIN